MDLLCFVIPTNYFLLYYIFILGFLVLFYLNRSIAVRFCIMIANKPPIGNTMGVPLSIS